ncbi:MAG: cyanophycinase, partial [Gemmatimonadaceae bacterium]
AGGATKYGDVVVLRTTGTDGYNRYLTDLGANSVTSLVISSTTGANSTYVQNVIGKAEVIFIAGGDQSTYVNLWKGTSLVSAVNARVAQGYPIGGTSAGLAVLGTYVYAALNASSVSSTVMANPYDVSVTLQPALFVVPLLRNVLTDSHFRVRDRMGRLITFMARVQQDGLSAPSSPPVAIGVDEQSGVGVSIDRSAVVFGPGAGAFMLNTTSASTRRCLTGSPLTYTDIAAQRVSPGQTFSLETWTGLTTTRYTLSITSGVLSSSTTSIY